MKKAKFLASHFDAGEEKYKAGEAYPLDDDTRLCIARGAAVEVDAPDDAPAAEAETKVAQAQAPADDTSAPAAEAKSAKAKK